MTDDAPAQLSLAGEEKPKTKYTFVSTDTGCVVERIGGFSCEVKYEDTYLKINGQPCGVYDEHRAERLLAETFADWVLPGGSKWDREECIGMIQSALHSRFFAQWKRIVQHIAPPDIEELARKMFNSVVGDAEILHIPELYTDEWKHLRSDLKKYHACRMYARFTESLAVDGGILVFTGLPDANTSLLSRAAQWRQALTPAVPYKALNKTLDSIQWGISWKQLHRLSTMRLENPITTRLHLAFALAASDHHNWGLHERIVLAASDQAVIEAAEALGYTITPRAKKDVLGDISHRILDYPEPYGGDLVGLARRSEAWHQARYRNDIAAITARNQPLAPETPLPLADLDYDKLAEAGIAPLRTAGDCYKEHEVMRHCIDTYASKAEKGLCFLFHVEHTFEHEGQTYHETATIEVLPDGTIGQAEGPNYNRNNQACKYGIQRLRWAWGTMLKGQMI